MLLSYERLSAKAYFIPLLGVLWCASEGMSMRSILGVLYAKRRASLIPTGVVCVLCRRVRTWQLEQQHRADRARMAWPSTWVCVVDVP